MRAWLHRLIHGNCSIYAPCRAADLRASWLAFQRTVKVLAAHDAPTAALVAVACLPADMSVVVEAALASALDSVSP